MKKASLIIAYILLSMHINAQHDHQQMSNDKPSTHGMLLFGSEDIYASHLPMFYSPHDYQVLLELTFSNEDKQKYIEHKKQHPNSPTYTIAPERFVLPDMINNPRPFKITVYQGHFERGGITILKDISVSIKHVVYFKKFNPKDAKIKTADYILFGNNKEQFLVHQISNKPDFEQIIEVKTSLQSFSEDQRYTILTLNRDNNSPIGVSGNTVMENNTSVQLLEQLYLEFNDLKN
ncbi:hypothetical protein [uncultured Dokdonia sp.]|uniref:hypothetical protein n=1 Tax=uncultured Dokdonia sp. TaxID=575653 RepID=UPI0026185E60|nr:hypothetical protein [uncultured Dokdonia sp.]